MKTSTKRSAELHPLVKETWDALEGPQRDYHGLFRPIDDMRINVQVGKESFARSMAIWDRILKSVEGSGFKVWFQQNPYRTIVTVEGQNLSICLREKTRRVERVYTEEEKARRLRFKHLYTSPEYEYRPSGKLILTVDYVNCHNQTVNKVSWSDGDKKRIEDRLDGFTDVLLKVAGDIQRSLARSEELKCQRDEQERVRQELARRKADEDKRIEELKKQATSFDCASAIRRFVESVREEAARRQSGTEVGSPLDVWTKWAENQAESLDPIEAVLTKLTAPVLDASFARSNPR